GAGGVASVKLGRVWAEAYIPYSNYRGAILDAQGKSWFPLDAGFKKLQAPGGLDVVKVLGFDPRGTLDDYLAVRDARTPLEFTRPRAADLLAQQQPGTAYDDVLNQRSLIPQALGMLPSTLPYPVRAVADVGFELPDELTHTLVIRGELQDQKLFEETFP